MPTVPMKDEGKPTAPRVAIFDTTLRTASSPGLQHEPGREDPARPADRAAGRGRDRGGLPIASPAEMDAVQAVAAEVRSAKVAALAGPSDRHRGGRQGAPGRRAPVIHTFLATSGIHLQYKLKLSPEEALRQAVEG